MIALVAGFFLVSYLLGPGAIYRLAFSVYLPSKRLQRTRTEEIVFSAIITVIPFLFTWMILLHTPLGGHPQFEGIPTKANAYSAVLSSLLSDSSTKTSSVASAYQRCVLEQLRFVLTLWLLCGIEGWVAGRFVSRYGNFADGSYSKALCDKFLLKHVSEWQVLFTTLSLSSKDPRTVLEVDVLCADILYRGRLVNWFTDSDGKLAGIFLQNAARYQRDKLARDRTEGKILPIEAYWKSIPGANLYLPSSSITSYNIRYLAPSEEDVFADELGGDVVIKLVDKSAPPA